MKRSLSLMLPLLALVACGHPTADTTAAAPASVPDTTLPASLPPAPPPPSTPADAAATSAAESGSAVQSSEQPQRKRFRDMDANGDRKLSREETAGTPLARRFDAIDTNHDGFLTHIEMRAAHDQAMARRAQRQGVPAGNQNRRQPAGKGMN